MIKYVYISYTHLSLSPTPPLRFGRLLQLRGADPQPDHGNMDGHHGKIHGKMMETCKDKIY